ncbi:hypothetical protein ACFSR7_17015 [Cohnella sp. GCM10020058]|uniref:hypothetical protein n=1 Tax=Cohnella sp. GCM10020058 TaxID=3317330 RepID=UPI00363DBAA0
MLYAGRENCIRTCIFCRPTTFDKIHANMQVNSKHKPEKALMQENTCAFASFLLERVDIAGNRCIFVGIAAKEQGGYVRPGHWNGWRKSHRQAFRTNQVSDIRQPKKETVSAIFPDGSSCLLLVAANLSQLQPLSQLK